MAFVDVDEVMQDAECFSAFTGNLAGLSDLAILLSGNPIDAVPVPCKIGDVVYGIRDYKGVPNVQKGFVGEMFFTKEMKLMIVVKHICRGYWLEKVFPTYEAAEAAIRKDGE